MIFRTFDFFSMNSLYSNLYFQNLNLLNNNYVSLYLPSIAWVMQDRLITVLTKEEPKDQTRTIFSSLYTELLKIENTIGFDSLLINEESLKEFYNDINLSNNCSKLEENEFNCDRFESITSSLDFTYKVPVFNMISMSKLFKEFFITEDGSLKASLNKTQLTYMINQINDLTGLFKKSLRDLQNLR